MESTTNNVLAVLDTMGIEYKNETGDRAKICCPFHEEKTPSMTIYDDNCCYCFGCQKFCWHDELIAKLADCSIIDAKKKLGTYDPNANYVYANPIGDKFKLPRIEFADPPQDFSEQFNKLPTDIPSEMQEFLESKALDGYATDLGKWRWHPKGTLKCWPDQEGICIPYFGPDNEIATFRLRKFDRMRGKFGHPLAPKGVPLQASFMVFNKKKPVYFCEGESDSLSMRAIGRNVVCLPGVGARKQLHSALATCFEWNIPMLIFCGDNDEAGQNFNKYALEVTMLLGGGKYLPQIRTLKLPQEYNLLENGAFKRKDINDFFKEGRLTQIITDFENGQTIAIPEPVSAPVQAEILVPATASDDEHWAPIVQKVKDIFGDGVEELPLSAIEGIF